jgi:hypothetical protein
MEGGMWSQYIVCLFEKGNRVTNFKTLNIWISIWEDASMENFSYVEH